MKYIVGETYTLTGDEPYWVGDVSVRTMYPDINFPTEAEFVGVDEGGDLMFKVPDWGVVWIAPETETEFDPVDKPEHYNTNLPEGIEVLDIIAAQTENLSGIRAVCQGNLLKYALRWQKKNGVEDLKKARAYIDRLIEEMS